MAKPDAKTWSLLSELYTLTAAVEGARMLVDLVDHDQAQDGHDALHAPGAASAVLALLHARMTELARMLRGETNPEALWAAHNASGPTAERPDIVFAPRPAAR